MSRVAKERQAMLFYKLTFLFPKVCVAGHENTVFTLTKTGVRNRHGNPSSKVYRVYSMTRVNLGKLDIQGVNRVPSITRVNMGKQDIQGYSVYSITRVNMG